MCVLANTAFVQCPPLPWYTNGKTGSEMKWPTQHWHSYDSWRLLHPRKTQTALYCNDWNDVAVSSVYKTAPGKTMQAKNHKDFHHRGWYLEDINHKLLEYWKTWAAKTNSGQFQLRQKAPAADVPLMIIHQSPQLMMAIMTVSQTVWYICNSLTSIFNRFTCMLNFHMPRSEAV